MNRRILFGLALFAFACTKNDSLPTVKTLPITEVTSEYAILGGEVTDDGGSTVFARGVCASEDSNYLSSLDDYGVWYTIDSSGTGSYTSKIMVKWHGAAYTLRNTHYVRAYATNSEGTAFGEILSFYPGDKPLTSASVEINSIDTDLTSATINYTFYYPAYITVREMGICYATHSEPTLDDEKIVISNTNGGEYTFTIVDLSPNTKYHIRSYDKNNWGVYYSSVKSFTTSN